MIQLYADAARPARGHASGSCTSTRSATRNCRPAYVERLNAWLDAHPDARDEEVGHKRATSPLQVFDVKDERLRAALADAPKIGESLCDECQEHFDAVRG